MRIRFWGTRGSLARPGPSTLRYGGNTSCVEIRADDGTLVVLDCGTGAFGLGQTLAPEQARRGHLLITHTHWDHIQGFPFFAPLFAAGNDWDLYAPGGEGRRLETTLAGQMEHTYFPVALAQMGATIRFHDLVEGGFTVGGFRVAAQYLNHPALTLGYRLEADGAAVVYAVDHEPHLREGPEAAGLLSRVEGAGPVHPEDRRHIAFLAGADLVIHDAQYTAEEYPGRITWGHTPAEVAVDYALAAHARRLALTHHDPLRDDDSVDRIVEVCRARVRASGGALEVIGAAEGLTLELSRQEGGARESEWPASPPATERRRGPETVLVVDDDPAVVDVLVDTLRLDGFRVLTAADGEAALRIARIERPAIILLDWHMPRLDGMVVARTLRAEADAYFREVPIVLLTAEVGAEGTKEGFAAGVTDYLTKPFKPPFVSARVRVWLTRTAPR